MNYLIGTGLITIGLLVIIYGDKNLQKDGGAVLKAFSMPGLNAIVLKWVVGVLCVWFGLGFLFGGLKV